MTDKGWKDLRRLAGLFFRPGINLPNCLTLVGVLMILIAAFRPSSSELASWVQSVGSIAAIYGAFWISKQQSDAEEKNRIKVEYAKASAIKDWLATAPQLSKNITEFTRINISEQGRLKAFKDVWFGMYKHQLGIFIQSMESIPTHELGSFDLVACFNGIRGGMEVVFAEAEYLSSLEVYSPSDGGDTLFGGLHLGDVQVELAWGHYKEIYELKFGKFKVNDS